jgi:acetyl/propionyl-CoA carboxylase alpha subunit
VAFLRRVVGSHAFATADLDTALIERERPRCSASRRCAELAAAGVVARVLVAEAAPEGRRPLVAARRLAAARRRAAAARPRDRRPSAGAC